MLTVKASPDKDPMSRQSVWCLSAPERQVLTRIAKGRGGCPRPAQVRRGTGGRGAAGRSRRGRVGCLGRQRGLLAAPGRSRGSRDGAEAPSQGAAVQPAGRRGRSAASAVGPVYAAGRPGAWDGAGDCVPHPLRDGALRAKKNELTPWRRGQRSYPPVPETDFAVPREAVRDLYGQPCALSGALQGRTADAATGAPGTPCHLRLRIRAARPLPPRLCVEPLGPRLMAHATAWCPGAPGAGPRGSSARLPSRTPDPGL